MFNQKKSEAMSAAERKFFRDREKKAALSDAEKARKAMLEKTAKLRQLRLAKEAEERATQAPKPVRKSRPARKSVKHRGT